MQPPADSNRGFVLVTSLIFLAIVTLLAATAMNSATLQEKMAANVRMRIIAQHVADAGLRQAEMLLTDPALYPLPMVGERLMLTDHPGKLRIWDPQTLAASASGGAVFLDDSLWQGTPPNGPEQYTYGPNGKQATAEFYVELLVFDSNSLNVNDTTGYAYYRVTARGQSEDPSAAAVVQSTFKLYYP